MSIVDDILREAQRLAARRGNTGRTQAELNRAQSVNENTKAAAKKKKKKKSSTTSQKKEEKEKTSTESRRIDRVSRYRGGDSATSDTSSNARFDSLNLRSVRPANKGADTQRTQAERDRIQSVKENSDFGADNWLAVNMAGEALRSKQKGVGGYLDQPEGEDFSFAAATSKSNMANNVDYLKSNWQNVPEDKRTEYGLYLIEAEGINKNNESIIMKAFEDASSADKFKYLETSTKVMGTGSDYTKQMAQAINADPNKDKGFAEKLYGDNYKTVVDENGNAQEVRTNTHNRNRLDDAIYSAQVRDAQTYEAQQKHIDKYIADGHYSGWDAARDRAADAVSSWWMDLYDAGVMAFTENLRKGQEGIEFTKPGENLKTLSEDGVFAFMAGTVTNRLSDIFTFFGLPQSLLSKAVLSPEDVEAIQERLFSVTDGFHNEIERRNRIYESADLDPATKFGIEMMGTTIEMVPGILASIFGTPAAGMAVFGAKAGGAAAKQAYRDGASLEDAVKFGLANGVAEAVVEKFFMGFGFMGKGIIAPTLKKFIPDGKVLSDTTLKVLQDSGFMDSMSYRILKRVAASGGEATEEMIMEILSPYLERATYNPDAMNATWKEVLYSGGLGAAVGTILGIPVMISEEVNASNRKKDYAAIVDDFRKQKMSQLNEAVSLGEMTEDEAKQVLNEIDDTLSGVGSLNVSDVAPEVKVAGEALDTVYDSYEEAKKAMMQEARTKKDGEKITANYIDNGVVKTFSTTAKGGTLGLGRSTEAGKEYQRIAQAKNVTERSGYQLNVKEEIINEVSSLSKAIGREVEFYRNGDATDHGQMNKKTGKIYVNADSSQSAARSVIAHELTHQMENTAGWKGIVELMKKHYGSSYESRRQERIDAYEAFGKPLKVDETRKTYDEADQELVAMFVEEKLLTDADTIREVVNTDKTLAQKIIAWINKVIQKLAGNKEQKMLVEARDLWNQALQEEQSGKVKPRTIEVEEEVTDDAAETLRLSIGINGELAEKATKVNTEDGMIPAKMLKTALKNREQLVKTYETKLIPDIKSNTEPAIKQNQSYGVSYEPTTICSRSLALEGLVELIAKKYKRPLTSAEQIIIAQESMLYAGDKAECLFCYQANAKRAYENALNKYLADRRDVIRRYNEGMDDETNYRIMMDFNFKTGKFRTGRKDTDSSQARFNTFIEIAKGNLEPVPVDLLINTRTLDESYERTDLPEDYKIQFDQIKEYARGASRAKGRTFYSTYRGEILDFAKKTIEKLNSAFGLRMFSFSEFSPAFMLEYMQVITDASIMGLKMLAYTKEPAFVEVFHGTNIAINVSLAGVENPEGGYDCDGMQSMDWNTAKELRSKYDNVGTVYVAKSDKEVKWALAQDWIDTVIPFHISGGSAAMSKDLGWKNYTSVQSEKSKIQGVKPRAIYPPEFQNDEQTYLDLCEKYNVYPKFNAMRKDKSYKNYMKLVNETRQKPADIKPVQPVFDMEAMDRVMKEFSGEYDAPLGGSRKVLEFAADEISEKVKERRAQMSFFEKNAKRKKPATLKELAAEELRFADLEIRRSVGKSEDAKYIDAVNRGDMNTAQRMVDEAAEIALANSKIRDEDGKLIVVYHGTDSEFNVFDRTKSRANMDIQGNFFSPWEDDAAGYGSNVRKFYLNITNPASESTGYKALSKFKGQDNAGIKARNHLEQLGYDGVNNENEEYIAFNANQIKSADPVTYYEEGNIIPLSERFNEENNDIRWSVGRSEDEEITRMQDEMLDDIINDASELTTTEKKAIDDSVVMSEEAIQAELDKIINDQKARREKPRTLADTLKASTNFEKGTARKSKKSVPKQDAQRRKERIRIAKEWHEQKAKPNYKKSRMLRSIEVKQRAEEFRRGIITYLVNNDRFISANENVVVDENNAEVAVRDTVTNDWDLSSVVNTYTPPVELTYLAEAEGMNVDEFYTIYSHIAYLKTGDMDSKKARRDRREAVIEYITSLKLNSKQKLFLYFDVAKYARSTAPVFLSGGTVTEEKGNARGRMMRALDNITVDMFSSAMSESEFYDGNKVTNQDVLDFADAVYEEHETKARDEFLRFFTGRIVAYSDKIMIDNAVARTNLMVEMPNEKDPLKQKVVNKWRNYKRNFIAEGEAFERLSDLVKSPLIKARYYDAKKALAIANEMIYGKNQRDLAGKVQGKSLYDIFEPILKADEKAGNNKLMTELTLLVNCRHDIYRWKVGKEYTGYELEECEEIVARISKEHPELLKVADEVVAYARNLLRMCVNSGRISEDEYNYFVEKYPYYVPTFRMNEDEYYHREGDKAPRTNSVIKKATGGDRDVLPLFDQLVRRTQEIVKACKKNQLATELAKAAMNPQTGSYIVEVTESVMQEDSDDTLHDLGLVEDIGTNTRKERGTDNIIPWYCNGTKMDIVVADKNLLFGWDRINYRRDEQDWQKTLRRINEFRRGVLTQYNPTFFITNHIKDVQDMFLYNQHAHRLAKYYPLAWKVMAGSLKDGSNRDYLQEYLSLGMSNASIFEYDEVQGGRRSKKSKAKRIAKLVTGMQAFDNINFVVEQVPRLAVYMETVDRLETQRKNGGNSYTDEEIRSIAGYQASDATLNFGRSGTVVKAGNTYGMTFLNAGVQGMDRARRMFTQIKDGDARTVTLNVLGLVFKSIMFGLGSNWILDWLYGGDDDWAEAIREFLYEDDADRIHQEYLEMADYQRLNYFLFVFPVGKEETWIRIPRGRLTTFMYSFGYNGEKALTTDADALDFIVDEWEVFSETVLFGNPLTNNIIGPMLQAKFNVDSWGEEIVTQYEDMGEGSRYLEYDEDTTDLAIAIADLGHKMTAGEDTGLARIFDFSPKKIDYLLEQYLGSYADLVMPFLNKDVNVGETSIDSLKSLLQKFYIDPTMSNRLAGDYYDLSEMYGNITTANEEDTPYAVANKIFMDTNSQLKPFREWSKAIGKDYDITKSEAIGYIDDMIAEAQMNGTDTTALEELRVMLNTEVEARGELTRKQRYELLSACKDQMNQLYRNATADALSLKDYAVANYYGKESNSDLYYEWMKTTKSPEWQITTFSDSGKEKWDECSALGVEAKTFVDFYNLYNSTNSSYDKNGKAINGQGKKDKLLKYLHSLDIPAEQKEALYLSVGGWSEKKMPHFTDGSSRTMEITAKFTHPLGETGEIILGFMADNNRHTQISVDKGSPVGASLVGSVSEINRSDKYGDSVTVKSTDSSGNNIIIQYFGLEEVGGKNEGGLKIYDYVEAGDIIGKAGKDGLKIKITVNGVPVDPATYINFGVASTISADGYSATRAGEEERDDDNKVASSGGGYGGGYGGGGRRGGGGRGGSGGGGYSSSTSGNYINAVASGRGNSGRGNSGSSTVAGQGTASPTYGMRGVYLPRASDYSPQVITDVARTLDTTPSTGRSTSRAMSNVSNVTPETTPSWRTKGSYWENILS